MLISSTFCRLMSTVYKSSVSLSSLYPKSSLSITAPVQIPEVPGSKFSGYIPVDELVVTYSRSSGAGGQHVNTTSSKVDIRFHIKSATWLNDDVKQKLLEMYKNKINKDGYLIVKSEKTRSQLYNQADAMASLREMIWRATIPARSAPSEETLHQIRARKEKANRIRLIEKRAHSMKKASRKDDFTL